MLDWQTLDNVLAQGAAAKAIDPEELFALTRSLVYTTVADTLEKATGRMRSADILMLVDTVYQRLCSMSSKSLAAHREKNGDALNMLHSLARESTMEFVRAMHYPDAPLEHILVAMGGGRSELAQLAASMDNPLDATQRVVLMMRHAEGLSPAETANALGVSNNEIRTIEASANEAIALHLLAPSPSALLH